jgi:hypothetical protein
MHSIIPFITLHYVWIALVLLYICNLLIGHRSQLDSWVTSHPKVGGVLKIVRALLPCEPWLIIQGISLLVKGTLPAKLLPVANIITVDTAAPSPPVTPPTN